MGGRGEKESGSLSDRKLAPEGATTPMAFEGGGEDVNTSEGGGTEILHGGGKKGEPFLQIVYFA